MSPTHKRHHQHKQIRIDDVDDDSDDVASCTHLTAFRTRHGAAKPWRALHDCLRVRPFGRAAVLRDPSDPIPRCGACQSTPTRLYACVACASVFCVRHAPDHALSHPSHSIAVDIDRAELFCVACVDQVYDAEFDSGIFRAQKTLCAILKHKYPVNGSAFKLGLKFLNW